jgi:hypothetical protein
MADMRETRAGTGLPTTQPRRPHHDLVAQPMPAPAYRAGRGVAPGSSVDHPSGTGRARAQEQSFRRKAVPLPKSAEAPTTRTQPPAQPVPIAKPPVPKPPEPVAPTAHSRDAHASASAPVGEAHDPAPPPIPSACQVRLTSDLAVTQPLRPITGPGSCGADDLVRLEAVVLKDGERIALTPAATLRCPMAEAVAHWVRDDVAPAAATLGSSVRKIGTATSYECRERDRVPGAKLSEHGRANALDLDDLTLANGTVVDLTDTRASHEFRELVRKSACNAFATVLGPGSDDFHKTHIHIDLIERRGNYRICQWDVLAAPEVGSALSPEPPKALKHGN